MHSEFQAFTSTVVLESIQKKIEVLEGWGEKAIAALSDGTLMVLEPQDTEAGPWQVVQAMKQFSKKPLLQMQVAQSK